MELHQLRYFVAVVETGSFGKAADRCHIAQPSLSQQIIKLEKELGEQLFDRLGRRIAVTDAGEALFPRAKLILAEVESIRTAVMEDVEEGRGRVIIGAIPTIAPYLLPPAVKSFRSAYPEAHIEVIEDVTANLIQMLVDAEIHVALMSTPVNDHRMDVERIATEPLLPVAAKAHALASRKRVRFEELDEQPAIVLHEMHCLSGQVNSLCEEQGIRQQIICRSSQLSTVLSMVSLGLGISVVPKACLKSAAAKGLACLSMAGSQPQRDIVAVWNHGREVSGLGRELIEEVRAAVRKSDAFEAADQ